ncbi:MAG TPA: hypothetical protein ENN22_01640 [bacterium]|nr:hypothetical protein [bacterium]
MKKIFILIILTNLVNPVWGQIKDIPVSELQRLSFNTEVHGMTAMIGNAAGLSLFPNDDGAFFNYNFLKPGEQDEINFALTMNNLAFAVQQFSLDNHTDHDFMRAYKLGLSVGGKVLSIGTANKIIEVQSSDRTKQVFSVDVGLIFQPASFLSLAAHARDLNEPVIENYQFQREYSAGFGIKLFSQRFKILAEAAWNDDIQYFEQARVKTGLSIMPIQNVELLVGGILKQGIVDILFQNEEFFAILQFPFFGGIRFLTTTRIDGHWHFLRYSASLLIPLKTIAF